jgi:hypothetical protein
MTRQDARPALEECGECRPFRGHPEAKEGWAVTRRSTTISTYVDDDKTTKNRLHLDFRPDDQGAEVRRLIGLGARRVDFGQGDQTWVVLADPDGNIFMVLSS